MTVKISKPAINLREELASLRNQGGLPKEDKLYVETLENGDFSAGTVGWTGYNYLASVSASNGQLTVTSTGTNNGSFAYQKINTKVGKTYKVTVNISTTSIAYVRADIGTTTPWSYLGGTSFSGTANVTKEFTFVATQDHTYIGLGTTNGSVGLSATYNFINVQEVGENLVTNGTFDGGLSGWTEHTSPTSVSTTGGVLRIQTTNHRSVYQDIAVKAGQTYQLRLDVTANTDGMARMYIGTPNSSFAFGNHNGLTVGSYLFTFVVGATDSVLRLQPATHAAVGDVSFDNFLLTEGNHNVIQSIPHGYDVKDVYIDGDLAREGEAYDYEVKTDGINQWIKPSVEPTATTETVVIGVRK